MIVKSSLLLLLEEIEKSLAGHRSQASLRSGLMEKQTITTSGLKSSDASVLMDKLDWTIANQSFLHLSLANEDSQRTVLFLIDA
jgi:hypothetical protein